MIGWRSFGFGLPRPEPRKLQSAVSTKRFETQPMQFIFWISVVGILYTYAGYPVLLRILGRAKPIARGSSTPTVSLILAAKNEERNLPRKIAELRSLHYPRALLQIVIASDGSTDGTERLLREAPDVVPVLLQPSVGKAEAINQAIQHATGEILVCLDVRQSLDPDAVGQLVSCLADPHVGAVSGELLLEDATGSPSADGLGLYWKIEKLTRKLESATGSVVGVTGAIYAIRRELFQPIPQGTLLDDVLIPMQVARAGKRVIFHPGAIARDRIFVDPGKEFGRKVRTLTGNYQMLQLAPWLLGPGNPLLFRLVSHKLLRLVVPLLLVTLLLSSAFARSPVYKIFFALQVVFYCLAALGLLRPGTRRKRIVGVPYTFCMLNAAAAMAFYNFVGGRARWA